jgi:hypothetical protein
MSLAGLSMTVTDGQKTSIHLYRNPEQAFTLDNHHWRKKMTNNEYTQLYRATASACSETTV